jgi:hypothetical protein
VAVLHEGSVGAIEELHALVGPSTYKSPSWRERCPDLGAVEDSDDMEGLYEAERGELVDARAFLRKLQLQS